jgi:hypothetical protein
VPAEAAAGESMTGVLAEVVAALNFEPSDPRRLIALCAGRITRALDAGAAPAALVRELRSCLAQMLDDPTGPASFVDEARAKRHARRLEYLLPAALAGANGRPDAG